MLPAAKRESLLLRALPIANFFELGGFAQDLEFLARLCVFEGASMYRFSENSTGRARLNVYLSILTIKLKVVTTGGREIRASLFAVRSIYHLRIVSMLVHDTGTKLAQNLCSGEHCQFPLIWRSHLGPVVPDNFVSLRVQACIS